MWSASFVTRRDDDDDHDDDERGALAATFDSEPSCPRGVHSTAAAVCLAPIDAEGDSGALECSAR